MDVDVVVLGTGLSESITAAALSKAGYKVAHIDRNPYYGGDDASLSVDELIAWADERASNSGVSSPYLIAQRKRFSRISYSGSIPPHSRQYAISLQPTIIPCIGPLIDSLIASGVSRYGGFKLLERVAIFAGPGAVKTVPGTKEDVFKNKELSLLHKRRLMRFLMFARAEFEDKTELQCNESVPFAQFLRAQFSLDEEVIQVIVFALAFCVSATDPTLPALQRIRRYFRSTGRYGPSSFLVGHYGGAGEIAQGFCRTSAVGGATYILGRSVTSINRPPSLGVSSRRYAVHLEDVPEQLYCDVLLASQDYANEGGGTASDASIAATDTYLFARCVAIIDKPIHFPGGSDESVSSSNMDDPMYTAHPETQQPQPSSEIDTAVLVFPPSSLNGGSTTSSVNALITGEGSQSTPRGKSIIYLTMPLSNDAGVTQTPEVLLRPYLDATLTLTSPGPSEQRNAIAPLFTLFYMQHSVIPSRSADSPDLSPTIQYTAPYAPHLPEIGDSAATIAESIFWRAVESLKAMGRHPERTDGGSDMEASTTHQIDSFWPPLEYVDEGEDW
ncbi:FAD/NAD(P)-binding domain-containing protein [Trametopsis cervina]|nr:FAD/NAD(P)-binding domain-containing protein [Trametopsis cervina]